MLSKTFSKLLALPAAFVIIVPVVNSLKQQTGINLGSTYASNSTNLIAEPPACGGTVSDQAGAVSYKPFEAYEPYERCVWIIRAPNADQYRVTVTQIGTGATLTITGLGLGSRFDQSVFNSTGAVEIMVNVIVVTFQAPSRNFEGYNGFAMSYYADNLGNGNETVAGTSTDNIFKASIGYHKYPSRNSNYSNNELSVFVLTQSTNLYSSSIKLQFLYISRGLENSTCYDKLSVYKFEAWIAPVGRWVPKGQICGDTKTELIPSGDLVMLVFESDNSVVGEGFDLVYSVC